MISQKEIEALQEMINLGEDDMRASYENEVYTEAEYWYWCRDVRDVALSALATLRENKKE